MNPNPKLSSLQILLCIIVLTQTIPCYNSQNNQQYETCGGLYRCGGVSVGYPFWGGNDRPISCGYPGFELSCQNDNNLTLDISSMSYYVRSIHNSTRTLRIAREDMWNTICPANPVQTSLNHTIFDYYRPSNDQNISLYYDCTQDRSFTPQTIPFPNRFNCSVDNVGFYFTTDLSVVISCRGNISVPVNQNQFQLLQSNTLLGTDTVGLLLNSLKSGFTIQWSADDDKCVGCVGSGGVCGYNQGSGSFACHCSDRTYDSTCGGNNRGSNSNGNTSNSGRNIGLFIGGAVLAGVGLGWLIFRYRQKRKQKKLPVQSSKSVLISKEVKGLPSSISEPISTDPSSSNFTKSTPSDYTSSNSDLGKGMASFYGVQVFTYDELEDATQNFDPSRELGDGGFGRVYYGVLSDGRVVAVKRLYENNFKRVEQFMNEVQILTTLRHENLVQLYGCTSKKSRELLLVYEYIPNGTLSDHLNGKRAKLDLLSWPIRLNIAIETAEALAYLHKSGIIHRDVKTNNILLDNDFHVKVADFGLSRLFPKDITHVSTAPQGTPGYIDPEYYQCYQLTEKSDVYSFGVVLIELLSSLQAVDTNRNRYDINLANMAINKIQNHALHELVDLSLGFETNSDVRRKVTLVSELAFRCLQQERDMRPNMEEVLNGLRRIKDEDLNGHNVEIVDILVDDDYQDDVVLLKGSSVESPSPDSLSNDRLANV